MDDGRISVNVLIQISSQITQKRSQLKVSSTDFVLQPWKLLQVTSKTLTGLICPEVFVFFFGSKACKIIKYIAI